MVSFITMLAISVFVFIASIILGFKTYKRKNRNKKITSIDNYKRKNENRLMLMSVIGLIFSVCTMVYTLFNSVPVPTIYPLDNETRMYSETAEVVINSYPLITTYYSLDGSDPKDGNIYENVFTITKTTTVSARNKFLWFWSELEQRSYEFNKNIIDNSNEKSDNVQVYGDDNITITGNVSGDININTHITSETTTSPETEILETEETSQFNFGQAMQYIFANEEIIDKEIINNEENEPTYSSIYPGVSYSYISDKVYLIEIIKGFRSINCSRTYYFDENGTLTFALMCDSEGEHRLYFYDDILINYKDINGNSHDINNDLDDYKCEWTELALKESREIYNGIQKPSKLEELSVKAYYDKDTVQTSIGGIDVLVKAETSFPADHVIISAVSDEVEEKSFNMHGGTSEWYFKANFYIKGTYKITITAYTSDGQSVSDSFTYTY